MEVLRAKILPSVPSPSSGAGVSLPAGLSGWLVIKIFQLALVKLFNVVVRLLTAGASGIRLTL